MINKIIQGDNLIQLKKLESESINCCITSPPYWGLRDYGTEGQLGLEKTPEEYVAKMVEVFAEVKRVLKKDGTLWLNLGSSYAGSGQGKNGDGSIGKLSEKQRSNKGTVVDEFRHGIGEILGFKPKDLVPIPWMVAMALQKDGWYLRQDLIWHKPNPMPESVTDRCTKSHEYIFLLAKSQKYYFDNEAIKEKTSDSYEGKRGKIKSRNKTQSAMMNRVFNIEYSPNMLRNKRSVWTVTTKPFKGAHFATFPEDLILPCVLAGCPEFMCKKCGKGREPIVKSDYQKREVEWHPEKYGNNDESGARRGRMQPTGQVYNTSKIIGFTDCGCNVGFEPGTILDPFSGAGTVGVVCKKNNRNFIGIELNPKYIEMAEKRIANTQESMF